MNNELKIDQFVIDIYRAARRSDAADFKEKVFHYLHQIIDFDSGVWATGTLQFGTHVHSIYLDNQPPEMAENYENYKQYDPLNTAHLANPGITHDLYDVISRSDFSELPICKHHTKVYNIEQALSTIRVDQKTNVISALSIYRSNADNSFSEVDRLIKQRVTPFIFDSYKSCLFISLNSANRRKLRSYVLYAVCDNEGVLYEAEEGFVDAMKSEWSSWEPPKLPDEIVVNFSDHDESRHTYNSFEITISSFNELISIKLFQFGPLSDLTPRERQIAFGLIDGKSYKQLANKFELSPSTITSHANSIYCKLDITGRNDLVNLMVNK